MQERALAGPIPVRAGLMRKAAPARVEEVDDRRVRFIVSTEAVDQAGDVVRQDGWDLTAYSANPVVLWAHQARELPIGRCVKLGVVPQTLGVTGASLHATVQFVPADMPVVGPLAEAILRMCRVGFLSGTSVGMIPLEVEAADDRTGPGELPALNILRAELAEFSIVPVPMNQEAVIAERQEFDPLQLF